MSRFGLVLAVVLVATPLGLTPTVLTTLAVAEEAQTLSAQDATEWFHQRVARWLELYHWLHRHPEVSLDEEQTAKKLADVWRGLGLTVTEQVGGHGIVGLLENGDGPTVMLRTDLDGLPVAEQTGLPYASESPGVMHACGHDMHMTTVTMVAEFLASHRECWSGALMVIGQPAEERGLGAMAMLRDGLFQRFRKPDYALALHVDSNTSPGTVSLSGGYVSANADSVDIIVRGKGGHGSAPHTTVDPIVLAADLVMTLQTIVSREVKPQDAAVITVGSITGGAKHNIIGDECRMQLTVRSHSEEVRAQLLAAIRRRTNALAEAYGAPEPSVIVSETVSAVNNDEHLAERMRALFEKLPGVERVLQRERGMGFEDFSEFGRAGVPSLMYSIGSVSPERLDAQRKAGGVSSLHSGLYYPDAEATLRAGFLTMSAATLELFGR